MEAKKYKFADGRKWGVCFYDESGKYITTQTYLTKRVAERACEKPDEYYKPIK